MSDVQRGPGWWLASDGRWYPPETHPQAQSPAPPTGPPTLPSGAWRPPDTGLPTSPPAHTQLYPQYPTHPMAAPVTYAYAVDRRSASTGLSGTIQGFFWAVAGTAAFAAILGVVALGAFNRYWDTPINSRAERDAYDDWLAIDDAFGGFSGFAFLCGLVVWILLMIWMNQAHKATQQLWHGPRQWGSGWTVGGWFIPGANAVIPYLVMSEIDKIALAPRTGGQVDVSWKQRSAAAIGKFWWILLVAGLVVYGIGDAVGNADDSGASDVRAGYGIMSAGFVLIAVSGGCGALYVRRVAARVSSTGIAESP